MSDASLDIEKLSLDEIWVRFYKVLQEIVVNYGPVIVYYVKAMYPQRWSLLLTKDYDCMSTVEVLTQIVNQKKCLDAVS